MRFPDKDRALTGEERGGEEEEKSSILPASPPPGGKSGFVLGVIRKGREGSRRSPMLGFHGWR